MIWLEREAKAGRVSDLGEPGGHRLWPLFFVAVGMALTAVSGLWTMFTALA